MPGYDYVGNAMKSAGYPAFRGPNYTNPATSTGPYDQGSALGSGYQASNFNLGEAGNVSQISDLINTINRSAQKTALQARIPNNPALETQSSQNINEELQGQVPADVIRLLGQQAAERGVGSGIGPTSANANAEYLRSLGLTSLQQMQEGQRNLTAADARNPAAPLFDPSTELITPYQGALLGEQGQGLNVQTINNLNNASLRQQQLNRTFGYQSPNVNYGAPTATGNGFTGSDLFPPDTTYTGNTGGTGSTYSTTYPSAPFQGNYFDYTPPSPLPTDYGLPADYGSPDYASTPTSMYG